MRSRTRSTRSPSSIRAATSSCSCPASARSARPMGELEQRALPPHDAAAALRAAIGGRAAARVRAHAGAARRARDQRRRDVADDPGHRLRRRLRASRASIATTRARASRSCSSRRSRRRAPISARAAAAACERRVLPALRGAGLRARPAFTDPEIKRVGLAGVILRMKSLRLGDIESSRSSIRRRSARSARATACSRSSARSTSNGELTEIGQQLGRLPLDPRLGRMILGGRDENALREVVVLAAALGLQDPRDRPQAVQQQADEAHSSSATRAATSSRWLKMWAFCQDRRKQLSRRQLQKLCREKFLSYHRMREWDEIHDQIVRIMKDLGFAPNARPASGEQIHRALLPGPALEDRHVQPRGAQLRRRAADPVRDPSVVARSRGSRPRG